MPGIELTFFIVATMGLCVGFMLKSVLIMKRAMLSSAYTEPRPLLLLIPPHQPVGWGCTRSWEGTQLGQLTPTDQRDIPYHITSFSAYKAGKRGTFGAMAFVFPSHRYT